MMMINSPSDGGELNRLNSLGVRVRSKVKIPLKNKVNYINTTNPPQALHRSFSAVMKESVQRCRFNYYARGTYYAVRYGSRSTCDMPGASAPRAFTVICNKKNTYCF